YSRASSRTPFASRCSRCSGGTQRSRKPTSCSPASSTSRRSTRTRSWRSGTEPSPSSVASWRAASPPRGTPTYASGSAGRPDPKRLSVPERTRAMVAPWGADTALAATAAEGPPRPRVGEERGDDGQRHRRGHRAERRVAEEEEHDDPHGRADPAHDRRDAEERTAARGDHLPTALPLEEERPPVAQHRRTAREHAGEMRDSLRSDECRRKAFRRVQHDD